MFECKQAQSHEQQVAEMMDSRLPKTEREHAAVREIERLEQRLAEAEAKLRWIPVSERLPNPGAYYHVWDDGEFTAYAYLENNGKWSDGEWFEYKNVTHWMPLIPTPQEGES